ncbi:MAG: KOW domain-containing RNA-binding protein [Clostridia bacterium]|nr:KOW domain-containing RNA-binding protein [Clostridia bacterium]MBR6889421.1 KOW domain-containing RNA-binding protein [Clostridia bacterium]
MKRLPVELGSIVISKAGRDRGRLFLVVAEVDDDFVMVANGALRKMDRQKKKRRRHLKPTGTVVQAVRERLAEGRPIEDHELRTWLSEEEEKLVQV